MKDLKARGSHLSEAATIRRRIHAAGGPLSQMALLTLLRRMEREDLTAHGFRSTFKDWASDCTNFPAGVLEVALSHAVEDKTEAAYRRGDLFEKRRKLMDAWTGYCGRPSGKSKVVSIGDHRASA